MKVTDATVHHVALAASSASELQGRLAEILDEYLTCVEQGLTVDVEQLTDGHPELAEPLRECLDGLALLQGGVSDFRIASPISEGGSHSSESTARRLGDYEIIEEIGRGGMGVVYEARQISLDRKVALKVLPFASVLDQKQLMRFQNEARAAAQLHHPNIVPIHGVGSDRGVNYYAMQFIEGRSLARLTSYACCTELTLFIKRIPGWTRAEQTAGTFLAGASRAMRPSARVPDEPLLPGAVGPHGPHAVGFQARSANR